MNESLTLALACTAGGVLGAFFFGGLWWTVRLGIGSQWVPLWFFGSLLVRTGTVLVGFYAVSAGHWERLLACLVGFVAARLAVTWLTRKAGPPAGVPEEV